jgi:protein ImuB
MHHEPRHRHDDDAPGLTALDLPLAEATADAAHLQQLLAERLGRAPLPAPALELSLGCDRLVPGTAPNAELFPTRRSEREGLTRLVERLQARLGREQVCRLEAVADHRPEHATRLLPAEAAAPAAASTAPPAPAPATSLPGAEPRPAWLRRGQPLWLLPTPQPLLSREGRPWLAGRPLPLLAGPERIESGWWDEQLVTRDYYIAARSDGALLWIFCDRLPLAEGPGGGWFLQGWFG